MASSTPITNQTSSHHSSTVNEDQNMTEAFPSLNQQTSTSRHSADATDASRTRGQSSTSTLQGRIRSASKTFQESNPPTGMWIATGQIASSIPSLSDIRRGSFGSDGWSGEGQTIEKERRASLTRRRSSQASEEARRRTSSNPNSPNALTKVKEVEQNELGVIPSGILMSGLSNSNAQQIPMDRIGPKKSADGNSADTSASPDTSPEKSDTRYKTTPFDNGYQFPPKHSWGEATSIFLGASWNFLKYKKGLGIVIILYALNIVAWGGMLFLLLCNASKAMCNPTCNDINSPRRIWIEIDSQILNALFCVTGFGTIPWRFRDLYYLLQYRIQKKELGLRRLAGINRGWFRLAGSQDLPTTLGPADIETESANVPESCVPFPLAKISDAPLTGIRAPPTALWKLDFVIWAMIWNTFLQAVLSGFMWGLNRYDRPSWSTGLFVALASIVAACGGIMAFLEGKTVKGIEGVPVSKKDQEKLGRDNELGITHWNNIKDEKPKEKKADVEKGFFKRKRKNPEVQEAIEESTGEDIR